jgi:4-diphosphocytidyl-2-C-methyl-D-erythritol kinase
MDAEVGDWSVWPAPAKLNLFLRIVGRRDDGYHLLQTAFQLLDWGDDVAIRPRSDGRIVRVRGAHGVADRDDLVVRAAQALQQACETPLGADIAVDKRIPQGGGFGGGSSDAATVLVALNWLWQLNLGDSRLQSIGLSLGADVPLFVAGNSAWAEGVGERLTPLRLPQRHFLLLDPGVGVPTGELFQAPDLTRNAAPIKMADFVGGCGFGNAFEPVLRARSPRVDQALQALSVFGTAQLTGSGSGCFVAFEQAADAEAACRQLAPQWRVWCAPGVVESPLRRALQSRTSAQRRAW